MWSSLSFTSTSKYSPISLMDSLVIIPSLPPLALLTVIPPASVPTAPPNVDGHQWRWESRLQPGEPWAQCRHAELVSGLNARGTLSLAGQDKRCERGESGSVIVLKRRDGDEAIRQCRP